MTQSAKAEAVHLTSSMAQLTVGAWLKSGAAPTGRVIAPCDQTQIQKTTATSWHGERMGDQEFAFPDCPMVNNVHLSAWTH
jgi:hypothetical protein